MSLTIEQARERAELHRCLGNCQRCPLFVMGNGPVRPVGRTPSALMIISEAPTREDDRSRMVTNTGAASELLRQSLRAVGVNLDDEVFFANTISCWPGFKAKAPVKGQVVACAPNLSAQIRVANPKLVLVLGATALGAVTDRKRKVTTDHGKLFRPLAGPLKDRWVMVTWHPAAVADKAQRNPGARTAFTADLATWVQFRKAMERAGWPDEGLRPWVPSGR